MLKNQYRLRRIEGERTRWLGESRLYELVPPYHASSLDIANAFEEIFMAEVYFDTQAHDYKA